MNGHHEADGPRNAQQRRSATDTWNREGAMALAKRLQEYWHARGYPAARFWAEPVSERFAKVGTYEIYRVVCNLVNGIPPRYRDVPGFASAQTPKVP
jgi:hypothetical protein